MKIARVADAILLTTAAVAVLGLIFISSQYRGDLAARTVAAHTQIAIFSRCLEDYKRDVGRYPSTEQGLAALRNRPDATPSWSGPYLSADIPRDPWNREYLYQCPHPTRSQPEIISYGADGKPGGDSHDSDIVSDRPMPRLR